MSRLLSGYKCWVVVPAVDALLLIAAHALAYMVRFEPGLSAAHWENIKFVLPWFVPVQLAILYYFGMYRDSWPRFKLGNALDVFKAALASLAVATVVLLFYNYFQGFSRAVFLLDGLFSFIVICGHRFSLYMLHKRLGPERLSDLGQTVSKKRVLILGAGDAGQQLAKEVQDDQGLSFQVMGFLDDDPAKIGGRIAGIPVLDATRNMTEAIQHTQAQEVWIAIASADQEQLARWAQNCSSGGLSCKILPRPEEMDKNKASIRGLRDLSHKDLLPLLRVRLDRERILSMFRAKTVLITGAGGAVGSELCRQLLDFEPGILVLMDRSEENLHEIESEILYGHGFDKYSTVLGDVRDTELLKSVFEQYKPDVVLHAAAYRQVSMLERNPWEAAHNNILASQELMHAAREHQAGHFVLLSTDRAMKPKNMLGASMRLAEMIMLAQEGQSSTRFKAVRLRNVLGSSDLTISMLKEQIDRGGPVTLTYPKETRHFLSGEEAARLTLQAGAMGEGKGIFVLDRGTQVCLSDLARNYIRFCGKEPDNEIEIRYTGPHPGEESHGEAGQELIDREEEITPTRHENIMVVKIPVPDMERLQAGLSRLKKCVYWHDAAGIRAELQRMIPEYVPDEAEAVLEPVANRNDLDGEATNARVRQARILKLADKPGKRGGSESKDL